jgi:hypothetical protein
LDLYIVLLAKRSDGGLRVEGVDFDLVYCWDGLGFRVYELLQLRPSSCQRGCVWKGEVEA